MPKQLISKVEEISGTQTIFIDLSCWSREDNKGSDPLRTNSMLSRRIERMGKSFFGAGYRTGIS